MGVSATTTTQPSSSTTTESSREIIYPVNSNIKNHKSYFRRKIKTVPTRSAEANRDDEKSIGSGSNNVNVAILDSKHSKDLRETNEDENNLDYGLMTLSAAGEGVNRNRTEDVVKKDDKSKTLSDQIAEGKYGLIEKELFSKVPKAPGIISYKTNSETPDDNEKTLGGLDKDDIWLAEDHLLILKGGLPNEKKNDASDEDWKPIDDYQAPPRPVKIPLNPRVPPPFPVQFENGPLQFIGYNQFSLFNPFTNETGFFKNAAGNGAAFAEPNRGNTKNVFTGTGAIKGLARDQIHDVVTPPPWVYSKDSDLLKQFPFNLPLPDQSFNRTEDFDEDDPSLFYPPPYSFVYKSNYTNLAPIGPLVPGIILPPPPDFFSIYNPDENKKPVKTPIDVINRIKEIHLNNRLSAVPSTTVTPFIKSTTYSTTLKEFTRKTKVPSTTPTTRLYKAKTTSLRAPTPAYSTTMKEGLIRPIYPFDTTTLKVHPVYIPTIDTTRIYPTTTLVTPTQADKAYKQDYGTQTHPIYFEYFDARTANPIKGSYEGPVYENAYSNPPTSSTLPPPVYKEPTKSKKPKSFYPPQIISSTLSPHPQYVDANFLFVTPKPDYGYGSVIASPRPYPGSTVSPISYNTAVPLQKPLVLKPVGRYEDELAAIRQTLDFYNAKKNSQKAPKVKAVYEFSFEAAKHKNANDFHPMLSYNQPGYYSPKPEISYSQLSDLIKTNNNNYYPTTTQSTTVKYYRSKPPATMPPKKNHQTETSSSPQMPYGQKLRPHQNINYYVRPAGVSSPNQQAQKIISYPSYETQSIPVNVDHGYRINNRNVKYRKQQPQSQQQQIYGPASEVVSLLNDTAVNYKQPQRPINPYSEYIDLSRFPPNNHQQIHQNSPPYIQQVPQYPIHHQIYPGPYQRPLPQHYQQHPLNLVKFEYPQIPQINPESVHITFYNKPMEKSNENFYVTPRH